MYPHLFLMFFLAVVIPATAQNAGGAREIWIKKGSVVAGAGTATDPFTVVVAADTDAVLATYRTPVYETSAGSIATVTNSDPAILKARTPTNLISGVPITISGFTQPGTEGLNGNWVVERVSAQEFKLRSAAGTGSFASRSYAATSSSATNQGGYTSAFKKVPPLTIHIAGDDPVPWNIATTANFPAYDPVAYPVYPTYQQGCYLYDQWILQGTKKGISTLRLESWPRVNGFPITYDVAVVASSDGSLGFWSEGAQVIDLIIDANYPNVSIPSNVSLGAIALAGPRTQIHGCQPKHMHNGTNENFWFQVSSISTGSYFISTLGYPDQSRQVEGLMIDGCFSDEANIGTNCGLFIANANPGNGAIVGRGPDLTQPLGASVINNTAINFRGNGVFSAGSNGLIQGNYSSLCGTSVYYDTGPEINVRITQNTFINAYDPPLNFAGGEGTNFSRFEIEDNVLSYQAANVNKWCIGSNRLGNGVLTHFIYRRNDLSIVGRPIGTNYGINLIGFDGLAVQDNTLPSYFTNRILNSTHVFIGHNVDENHDSVDFATGNTQTLTPSNYWRWQNFNIITNTGIAADTANPKNDGYPNLLKYATGLDPLVGSTTPLMIFDKVADLQKLAFSRNTSALDTIMTIEACDSLGDSWTPLAQSRYGAPFFSSIPEVVATESGSENVRNISVEDFRFRTMTQPAGQFYRLKITY